MWERIVAFFMSIIAFFASLFGGAQINNCNFYKDLAYGTDERQIMDLCLPKDNDGEVGLVLFIHGGAWIAGNKDGYEDNIKSTCNDFGYAAAAINYRYLSENVSLKDITNDIDAALTKIKQVGAENGISINKVLLTGASAGGHLSMLYAYSKKETAPITPVAVVNYCGPTDLSDDNFYYNSDLGMNSELGTFEVIDQLFSYACGQSFTHETKAEARQALLKVSPIYYVDENTVPTVINHGKKDTIVPFSNASALAAKFEEYGVTYDFNIYPNSGHGLSDDKANEKTADKLMLQYAETYLGKEN